MGNTLQSAQVHQRSVVHPHACGEYNHIAGTPTNEYGPSPRVWGILACRRVKRVADRSIPTRVGNTNRIVPACNVCSVHPHACGEYVKVFVSVNYPSGPSPRVWGILSQCPLLCLRDRSIPTRVGNTFVDYTSVLADAVHPHACGEYIHLLIKQTPHFGPSPRVWGILSNILLLCFFSRSIPTRVGNTQAPLARLPHQPVHPHACGEYAGLMSFAIAACGPSPRVWGIQFQCSCTTTIQRSIPTRVGNTTCSPFITNATMVHPHACGEYSPGSCLNIS